MVTYTNGRVFPSVLQDSSASHALKTLISVSSVILLGLICAYHALEVQVSSPGPTAGRGSRGERWLRVRGKEGRKGRKREGSREGGKEGTVGGKEGRIDGRITTL